MMLNFDLENITTTEFGIGRDDVETGVRVLSYVPSDRSVQVALREIVESTWRLMNESEEAPVEYQPAEKYASTEYVQVSLADDRGASVREVHLANNLTTASLVGSDTQAIFCYFARFSDTTGRRLTGLRRAAQFKGVLKSRNRLIRWGNDALKMIDDDVFKLDQDFDLLIDSDTIHVLHPSGFEAIAQLQSEVLAAVPENIGSVQKDLPFVDFASVQEYAGIHPRAARYLASIRAQKETKKIDKRKLKALCARTAVQIRERSGIISVEDDQVMGFLEVLDRRRYEIELVKDSPERYRAASRRKLG